MHFVLYLYKEIRSDIETCSKKLTIPYFNFGKYHIRPALKSCSFPIHRPGEMKNSQEPPAGRNIFLYAISLSKKIYEKKI